MPFSFLNHIVHWMISGTLVEGSDPGVYIYTMSDTMKDLKLPKGIYLVNAKAVALDGYEAVDMIQFHIDPPGESEGVSLSTNASIELTATIIMCAVIGGIFVHRKRRHMTDCC